MIFKPMLRCGIKFLFRKYSIIQHHLLNFWFNKPKMYYTSLTRNVIVNKR